MSATEDQEVLAAMIKDAYYAARDNGGTMHTAADDAAKAILATRVPTSGHTITWTLDEGRIIHPRVTCSEPENADCRIQGGDDCDCETWTIEHDEQGPFHRLPLVEFASSSGHGEVEVTHRMLPGHPCVVASWLENGDETELDSLGPVEIVIPFEPVWAGDFYQWKPTVEKVG